MILKIFTDGGSKGNPGPASIGIVFYLDGKKIFTHRGDIGVATNNEAEYTAVVQALEKLKSPSFAEATVGKQNSKVEFYSDSQLLVRQVNGFYKVKNARIREFILKIRILEREIGTPISYHQIPREENTVADALVNNK